MAPIEIGVGGQRGEDFRVSCPLYPQADFPKMAQNPFVRRGRGRGRVISIYGKIPFL